MDPNNFVKVAEGTYDETYETKPEHNNQFNNFKQRTYDYEELEEALFNHKSSTYG